MRIQSLIARSFLCFAAMGMGTMLAQTPIPGPNDNPTANTGALKTQVETGGSYDPHSGNATRSVTDLRVPGALGVYGLDFTRHWNSLRNDRYENLYFSDAPVPEQTTSFGSPGWSHSWNWSAIESRDDHQLVDGGPTIYSTAMTITFPDGHATKYKISHQVPLAFGDPGPARQWSGPPYTAGEANWPVSEGIHDRLCAMPPDGSSFWLYLADGGSVYFSKDPTWGYQANTVLDPHGLSTVLHYNGEGNLDWVEQDGGRRLTIRWDKYCDAQQCWSSKVIGRVENAGSGSTQAVEYRYSWLNGWLTLSEVWYQNDPVPDQCVKAHYTYTSYTPPTGFFFAGPLLSTADDPRFDGPMRSIRYSYRDPATACRPQTQPSPLNELYTGAHLDYFYAGPTSIAAEQSGTTGFTVSSFAIGCYDGTRTEYNGFNAVRKFYYGHSAGEQGSFHCLGYQLAKLTDFDTSPAGAPFRRQNYLAGQPRQIWDGRNILTESIVTPFNPATGQAGDDSGQPSEIHYIDGSTYKYDRINAGSSDSQDFTRVPNPYSHWLFSTTDEGTKTAIYTRDARRRVRRIDYPDNGGYETFVYDNGNPNGFNQVTSHRLTSGAIVTYVYDGRGLLKQEYNSEDIALSGLDYTSYTYYGPGNHPEWTDLVATVQNPRARAAGKTYSTMMKYNGRFQITEVHYPSTNGTADPFVKYEYDPSGNGNCIAITNELGYRSTYEYDDYRRCTSYTEQLNGPNWNGTTTQVSRRWDWTYERSIQGGGSFAPSTHT